MRWFDANSPRWWAVAVSVLLPLLVILHLGQDRNWDLANYHLYNPHAWLSGRYGFDIAPAQLQTWHNPLLDVPLYLLVKADMPGLLISLWLTLPAMAALYAGSRLLTRLVGRPLAAWEVLTFAVLAISAPALYSTTGSSMNDGMVAAGMVAALALVCRPDTTWRSWLLAGLIAGCTAGLKLSAMVYCMGLAASALVAGPPARLPSRVFALATGGLLGFVLGYGLWGWQLWQTHANPTFPYFNQIFLSPDLGPESWADQRFRPDTLLDGLLVPLRLLVTASDVSELPVRTPLLLLGCLSIGGLLWRGGTTHAARRSLHAVSAFFVVSFLIWTVQYGILRYTAPLEVTSAALAIAWLSGLPRRAYPIAAVALAVAVAAFTVRPDWGRRPFSSHFLAADWPSLPAGSMVVTSGGSPLAFFALGLPGDVPMVAVHNNILHPQRCEGLQQQVESRIRGHAGQFWLLEEDQEHADLQRGRQLARDSYGLVVEGTCKPIRTSFGPVRLCPMIRRDATIVCAVAQPSS